MSWSAHARFNEQLRVLLQAGLPISESVYQAAETAGAPYRGQATMLRERLMSGEQLSAVLPSVPAPPFFIALIKAGETSGHLPELCGELGAHYRHNVELRNLIIAKMIYPVILLHITLVAAAMPLVFMFGWPAWLIAVGPVGLWTLVVGVFLVGKFMPAHTVSTWLLRQPFAGVVWPLLAANTCSVLRASLTAGLLFGDALELAAPACGNQVLGRRLAQAGADLRQGGLPNLTVALERCGMPSLVLDLVRTGEQSGTLDDQLRQAALVMRNTFQLRSEWTSRVACGLFYTIAIAAAVVTVVSIWLSYRGLISDTINEIG